MKVVAVLSLFALLTQLPLLDANHSAHSTHPTTHHTTRPTPPAHDVKLSKPSLPIVYNDDSLWSRFKRLVGFESHHSLKPIPPTHSSTPTKTPTNQHVTQTLIKLVQHKKQPQARVAAGSTITYKNTVKKHSTTTNPNSRGRRSKPLKRLVAKSKAFKNQLTPTQNSHKQTHHVGQTKHVEQHDKHVEQHDKHVEQKLAANRLNKLVTRRTSVKRPKTAPTQQLHPTPSSVNHPVNAAVQNSRPLHREAYAALPSVSVDFQSRPAEALTADPENGGDSKESTTTTTTGSAEGGGDAGGDDGSKDNGKASGDSSGGDTAAAGGGDAASGGGDAASGGGDVASGGGDVASGGGDAAKDGAANESKDNAGASGGSDDSGKDSASGDGGNGGGSGDNSGGSSDSGASSTDNNSGGSTDNSSSSSDSKPADPAPADTWEFPVKPILKSRATDRFLEAFQTNKALAVDKLMEDGVNNDMIQHLDVIINRLVELDHATDIIESKIADAAKPAAPADDSPKKDDSASNTSATTDSASVDSEDEESFESFARRVRDNVYEEAGHAEIDSAMRGEECLWCEYARQLVTDMTAQL